MANPNDPYHQGYGNESQQPQYAGSHAMSEGFVQSMFAADAKVADRVTFIRNTYLHLGGAVLLFALLEAIVLNFVAPAIGEATIIGWFSGYNVLILLGAFMAASYVAQSWANSDTSRSVQYAGLGLYVLAETLIFMPLLLIASKFFPGSIETAAVATVAIFGGLTVFVFVTRVDFSFLRMFLIVGSLAAVAAVVASIVMQNANLMGIWFSAAMILLAAGYILYYTSDVMRRYRTDQHVAASLALFSALALLFWYVLRIVMSLRE